MFKIFQDYPNLFVAFSTKEDGNMRLGENPSREVFENRERFFTRVGIDAQDVVAGHLVHGNGIEVVGESERGEIIEKTDGLITSTENTFVCVTVADCLPIFLYDPTKKGVGLLHAGWRGLDKHIVAVGVEQMEKEFGSKAEDTRAGIGPSIEAHHYKVDKETAGRFEGFSDAVIGRKGKIFLDLKRIASQQLQDAGVKKENIETRPVCTHCATETYFSYRREKKYPPATMVAIMGMKEL